MIMNKFSSSFHNKIFISAIFEAKAVSEDVDNQKRDNFDTCETVSAGASWNKIITIFKSYSIFDKFQLHLNNNIIGANSVRL